LPINVI
jgi:hypothetical protein